MADTVCTLLSNCESLNLGAVPTNAIDAGATKVQVVVTDGGRTLIQVIDNGKGMSETDARMAFERHATSKIREAADLFALRTMGFRGEALASIAAVAQVELRSCLEGEDLGTSLCISGSKVESQETVACPKGSNFQVKNLFFNIPARRKFLKSNQTELSNILTEFERIALVNPDVSFTLHHNGTEMLNLPAIQLKQRIMGVFGKKINQELLSVNVEDIANIFALHKRWSFLLVTLKKRMLNACYLLSPCNSTKSSSVVMIFCNLLRHRNKT